MVVAKVIAAVDFDLQGMNAAARIAVTLDDVAAGEWIVERDVETALPDNAERIGGQPPGRGPAEPVANDDWRYAVSRRRHRMAVEQQGTAEFVAHPLESIVNGAMIWPVRLIEPVFQVGWTDRLPPKIAVGGRSGRNDAQAAPSAGRRPRQHRGPDDRRIDFILRPVAVDGRARSPGDDGADAGGNGLRN